MELRWPRALDARYWPMLALALCRLNSCAVLFSRMLAVAAHCLGTSTAADLAPQCFSRSCRPRSSHLVSLG